MSNLFQKISKGSVLLWNVDDESELPTRKEIIRLLGTENFICYKGNGHHREYVRLIGHLKVCLDPNKKEEMPGYWETVSISHFYFTAERISPNSFFVLKYSSKCVGSFYIDYHVLESLRELTRIYHRAWDIFNEVKRWSEKVEKYKNEIRENNTHDSVIEGFDVATLKAMTEGYGKQAIDQALANLQDWHDKHYWLSQPSQTVSDELAEQAADA